MPVFEAVAWVVTQPKLSNQLLAKLESLIKFEFTVRRLPDHTVSHTYSDTYLHTLILAYLPVHTVSHTLHGFDGQPPGQLGTCTP